MKIYTIASIVMLSTASCKNKGERTESKTWNAPTSFTPWGQVKHVTHTIPLLPPAEHSHLFLGTKKFYLSHIPLNIEPHMFQIIYEVEIDRNNPTMQKYLNEQSSANGTLVFSVIPKISLAEIAPGKAFKAPLFRGAYTFKGFLDQNGKPTQPPLGVLDLRVTNILLKRQISVHYEMEKMDPNSKYQHFAFGNNEEIWAIPRLTTLKFPQIDYVYKADPKTNFCTDSCIYGYSFDPNTNFFQYAEKGAIPHTTIGNINNPETLVHFSLGRPVFHNPYLEAKPLFHYLGVQPKQSNEHSHGSPNNPY